MPTLAAPGHFSPAQKAGGRRHSWERPQHCRQQPGGPETSPPLPGWSLWPPQSGSGRTSGQASPPRELSPSHRGICPPTGHSDASPQGCVGPGAGGRREHEVQHGGPGRMEAEAIPGGSAPPAALPLDHCHFDVHSLPRLTQPLFLGDGPEGRTLVGVRTSTLRPSPRDFTPGSATVLPLNPPLPLSGPQSPRL